MKYISNGKMVKSQVWQRQKRVVCQCPHFATERKFTKKPSYCKQVFLQECVPFRHREKYALAYDRKPLNIWKNACFCGMI